MADVTNGVPGATVAVGGSRLQGDGEEGSVVWRILPAPGTLLLLR